MQGQGAGTGVTTGRGSKGRCKGSRALVCLDISSYLQLTANNRCKPFCFTAGLVSRGGLLWSANHNIQSHNSHMQSRDRISLSFNLSGYDRLQAPSVRGSIFIPVTGITAF